MTPQNPTVFASLKDLQGHCKQKIQMHQALKKFFLKKVTKKGIHVDKKRHFVDKIALDVQERDMYVDV